MLIWKAQATVNNMPAYGISTTPPPRTGFGQVPQPIGIPPNVFTQLSGAVPGFPGLTSGTSGLIASQQAGNVSPQTLNALKTGSAQFGVASGMPGSGLEQNQLFGNIAGFSENQQQKGIQNYLSLIGALGPTQTNPNLAAEISARNADLAAAPDPRMAAEEQFNLWLRGAQAAQGMAGYGSVGRWPGGGTLGPASGVSHSNWGGMGINPPDALGFPSYDMSSQQGYGTATATATPPSGGWPGAPAPWGSGFAVGPRTRTGSSYSGAFYPGLTPEEEQAILGGESLGRNQGFESSEYGGG